MNAISQKQLIRMAHAAVGSYLSGGKIETFWLLLIAFYENVGHF